MIKLEYKGTYGAAKSSFLVYDKGHLRNDVNDERCHIFDTTPKEIS